MALSRAQRVVVVASLLVCVGAPSLARALRPGLPTRPSWSDYLRCSTRSALVTPVPPVRRSEVPRNVQAAGAGQRTPNAEAVRATPRA